MPTTKRKDRIALDGHAQVSFEAEQVDEGAFLDVVEDVQRRLDEAGIRNALMGGLASAAMGRPRWTKDVDVFLRGEDADRALEALNDAGYDTQATNPHWIYKAKRDGVLVDLIFRAKGDIYLDEDMAARLIDATFRGRRVRVIPPEDLVVIKAIIHDEETPRHWFDALGVITSSEIDWEYLLRRAQSGPRRILALLAYAQSIDIVVPDAVIVELVGMVYQA